MSLSLVFAGTPEFASDILQDLLKTEHQILAVYTQADKPKGRGRELSQSPVKTLALQHHLPVFQPLTLKSTTAEDELLNFKPDLLLVAAYGLLLPRNILSIPRLGCINVHASLLPRWRGASPIQHAILAGDMITGITMMQMDAGLDTGAILESYPVGIEDTDTTFTLTNKLSQMAQQILPEFLSKLESGMITPKQQEDTLATLAPKINKEDAKLDWAESGIVLDRKIRAYNPWPIAFTFYQGLRLRIFKASPILIPSDAPPGSILKVDDLGIEVATQHDRLKIEELQFEGKKRLLVKDILNAKPDFFKPGSKFE